MIDAVATIFTIIFNSTWTDVAIIIIAVFKKADPVTIEVVIGCTQITVVV